MTYNKKHYISWEDFHTDTLALAEIIKFKHTVINGIVCITRGGLVPSAIVSSVLDIKKIDILAVSTYLENKNQNNDIDVMVRPSTAEKDLGENWVVIDELVDTGKTIDYISSILPKASIYSVYTKTTDNKNLKNYVKQFDKKIWLYFPWEKDFYYDKD